MMSCRLQMLILPPTFKILKVKIYHLSKWLLFVMNQIFQKGGWTGRFTPDLRLLSVLWASASSPVKRDFGISKIFSGSNSL